VVLIAAYLQWHLERAFAVHYQWWGGRARSRFLITSQSLWMARWTGALQRGLPRTAGHEAGEAALFDVVEGAIEYGVKEISAYAFSTENWRRSPDEVSS
jgi:undecaprenyl pyrophosphate synthase